MLRTIMNRHTLPRLLAFSSANDGAAVTPSFGRGYGTYTRPAAGVNRLTLAENFHRAPVLVSALGSDGALGGYPVLGADPTLSVLDPKGLDAAGADDDSILHSLCLGHRSDSTDLYALRQSIRVGLDRPRYIGAKVTGGAAAVYSIGYPDFLSLTVNGVGDYTLTFRKNFGLTPIVVPTLVGTAGGIKVGTVSNSSVQILTSTAAGAAAHRDFYLHICGTLSTHEHFTKRRALKATHLEPELIGLHISVSGGTPSLSVGGGYGTIADDGVGEFTFTLTTTPEKKRELIVIGNANNRVHIANSDTNSFEIKCSDAAGTLEDPTDVNLLVLAYGQADEFYQGS